MLHDFLVIKIIIKFLLIPIFSFGGVLLVLIIFGPLLAGLCTYFDWLEEKELEKKNRGE